jgi:hypothetical protein
VIAFAILAVVVVGALLSWQLARAPRSSPVLGGEPPEASSRRTGWFVVWVVGAVVLSVGLVTGFSIGVLLVPVGITLLLLASIRAPRPPALWGLFVGAVVGVGTAALLLLLGD